MSPELIALGKRAVACRGWRWLAGSRRQLSEPLIYVRPAELAKGKWAIFLPEDGSDDWDVSRVEEDGDPLQQIGSRAAPDGRWISYIPDLSDPATLGCLLSLVREAHKEPTAHPLPCENDRPGWPDPRAVWHIERLNASEAEWLRLDGAWGGGVGLADPIAAFSEAEALVAALEGAP